MKKKIIIIVTVLLIGSAITVGIVFARKWHQPLGESLALPTNTSTEIMLSDSTEIEHSDKTEFPLVTDTPSLDNTSTIIPTPTTPKPVCGGPPIMYILGIGVDSDDPNYLYGLADVIRIARVDFVTPKVTVLTIPRDLWVKIPDIIEKYADRAEYGKLNLSYFYGGPGMGFYEGPGGGPGLLARTIAHNYGLNVDHYGAVNMYAFEQIIDALGGIDIYLDQDWDGRPVDEITVDLGYFTAGQHHMSGAEALRFSRIRKKYSDVTRSENQTLVICAVKEKALRPSVIGSIPELVTSLIGMVQTDLTPAQISQLICLLPKLSNENLHFIRFPDEMLVQGSEYDPNYQKTTFVWDIEIEEIRQFMRDFENDAIPIDTSGVMSCP
jgi:LCP family protein required for cell wall assembly